MGTNRERERERERRREIKNKLLFIILLIIVCCPTQFLSGDINWAEFSLVLPLLALSVGILSSLLGVGGGELMGPLMLHLKV